MREPIPFAEQKVFLINFGFVWAGLMFANVTIIWTADEHPITRAVGE